MVERAALSSTAPSSTSRWTGTGRRSCSSTGSASRASSGTASLTALGTGYKLVRVDLRGAGRSRELERGSSRSSAGRPTSAPCSTASGSSDRSSSGTRSGRRSRSSSRSSAPTASSALVLIGGEADLSNLAPRMLASAERIESMGLETWIEEFWSKNPPFSEPSLAAGRRDPRRVPGPPARERSGRLRAPVPGDRSGGAPRPGGSARSVTRCSSSSVASTTARCPSTAASSPARSRTRRLVELPDAGHSIPLEAPEATAAAIADVPRGARGAPLPTAAPRSCARTRRRATRREGPFGHLDVRWVVGAHTGASLIAFGQSTYPFGATHENHHHPNAEEVVMVVSGRGTQIVGDRRPRPRPRRHLLHPAEHPAPDHGHLGRRGLRDPVGLRRRSKHRTGGLRPAPRRRGEGAVSDVRTDPLTAEEIATYHEQGFLFPIRVLTDEQVEELREALDDHLEGRRQSEQYELTDPIVDSSHGETTGDRRLRDGDGGRRGDARRSRTRCRSCSTSGSATSASGRSTRTR